MSLTSDPTAATLPGRNATRTVVQTAPMVYLGSTDLTRLSEKQFAS